MRLARAASFAIAVGFAAGSALGQFSVEAGKCADGEFMGLDLAIEYCDRAIASGRVTGRELADTHYNRAVSFLRKNDPARALKDLSEAIRIYPTDALPYKARASLRLGRKEYEEACADLDEAIRLEPDFAEAYPLRGSAWLARGDLERAIADFDRTLQMAPTTDTRSLLGAGIALGGGRGPPSFSGSFPYQKRSQVFDRSGMDAMAYLGRSAARMQKGDREGAEADLDEWVRLLPQYGRTKYGVRGSLWLSLDNYELAIQDYNRAISTNHEDLASLAWRGLAQMLKGDLAAATSDFTAVIRVNPGNYGLLRLRGYTRFFGGNYEAAAADLQQALRLNPAEPYVMAWLFLARARAGGDLQKLRSELAVQSAALKRRRWPYPVLALLLGELKPENLAGAAKTADGKLTRERECEAGYFTAQLHLLSNQSREARELLQSAESACPRNFFERAGAVAELRALSR